ncbi:AAA+-type ATPase [Neophaeococcomyces mojaviensis]|uniref:AAA+-type ATPase n=1 Tax=Neophaeococcomyces mojaviensis TaxID=3383035 RepID=A0ACC2ZVN6_9EURO|nr:AAA+-type ATPase [Knufia sp. JES_112]
MVHLKCRPSEAEKDPILVFMTAAQMLNLKLKNGDLCVISAVNQDNTVTAVAWLTTKADLKDGVIGISKLLQEHANIKLGNEISVSKSEDVLQDSQAVLVRIVGDKLDAEDKRHWEFNASIVIRDGYRYVIPGQKFIVAVGKQRKEFEVTASRNDTIYKVSDKTTVYIGAAETNGAVQIPRTTFDQIGGLQAQKQEIRRILQRSFDTGHVEAFLPPRSGARGMLLYGAAGTGKTLLRKAIEAEHDWEKVVEWEPSIKPVKSPGHSLVHVDITFKLSDSDSKALRRFFEASSNTTLIVGEIQDPNDLHKSLRTGSTFAREIEVPIPDAQQRHEILKVMTSDHLNEHILNEAAAKTHGYVGDDLYRLLAQLNDNLDSDSGPASGDTANTNATNRQPTSNHLIQALTKIRPSALQHVFLEKPNVKWSDIGGQETFKARLRNAVEWPLKFPQELKSYGTAAKKGILLYGPPGCSKTMLVKALATESDFNFLAVKGAELISMYVGESERATREVFRKARAASPCIIFFDEIDAIARRASGSSELNVLTTLLNEMDGFEELKDVLVVAATNKPQVIDPALLRPGRFDNVVYIGPPDATTREAILRERISKTPKFSQQVRDGVSKYVEMTEGMSGAEVVAICQTAGELAFGSGELPDILPAHMEQAIAEMPRSINQAMIEDYKAWNAERAAGG